MPRDHFIVRLGPEPRRLFQTLFGIDCIREFVSESAPITVFSLRSLNDEARGWIASRGADLIDYQNPKSFFELAQHLAPKGDRVVILSPGTLLGGPLELRIEGAAFAATGIEVDSDWTRMLSKAIPGSGSPLFDLRLAIADAALWKTLVGRAGVWTEWLARKDATEGPERDLSLALSLAVAESQVLSIRLNPDYAVTSADEIRGVGRNPFAFLVPESQRFDLGIRPARIQGIFRLLSKIRGLLMKRLIDDFEAEAFWNMVYDPETISEAPLSLAHALPADVKRAAVSDSMGGQSDLDVLDFGAGPAAYMSEIRCRSYTAVDVSDAGLRLAAGAVEGANLIKAYAHEYRGERADLVLCLDVLQMIGTRERYEATVRRAIEATRDSLLISGFYGPIRSLIEMVSGYVGERYYEPIHETVARLVPGGEVSLTKSSQGLGIVRWKRPKTIGSRLVSRFEKSLPPPPDEREFASLAMRHPYPRPAVGPEGPKLLIYGLGRTGSTAMRRILSRHPDVRAANEPFWAGRAEPDTRSDDLPPFAGKVLDRPHDFEKILGELWSEFNVVKHVVNYPGWPFLHSYPFNRILLVREGQSILFLTRKNLVRRFASEFIARQTGDWVEGRGEEFDFEPMDIERYVGPLHLAHAVQQSHRRWLDEAKVPYMDATYEWFFDRDVPIEERAKRIGAVLEYAGFDPAGLTTDGIRESLRETEKGVRSEQTYRRIPNYREIDAELGSDELGWLLPRGADEGR